MHKPTLTYHSYDKKLATHADGYSKTTQSLFRYLAYRDILFLLEKYASGKIALDYWLRNRNFYSISN